jgi:Holliday junction resolvasome RuvABC endonuclease subunit
MNKIKANQSLVLAITPSTRGFGFAVLEGKETLVDWGVKSVKGDKNAQVLVKVKELIVHYKPGLLVLEDSLSEYSRRSVRIRKLSQRLIALAESHTITVALFSREHVRTVFLADGKGTKHALAEAIVKRFPEELSFRLPPKRKPWMSEDPRMDIFAAVALVLAFEH